jgi:hypothetical protein
MPIHIDGSQYRDFIDYIEAALRRRVFPSGKQYGSMNYGIGYVMRRDDSAGCILSFGHCNGSQFDITINKFMVNRGKHGEYEVKLQTVGSPAGIHDVGVVLRKILMEWGLAQDNVTNLDEGIILREYQD